MQGNQMRVYAVLFGPLVLWIIVLPLFLLALGILHALGFESESQAVLTFVNDVMKGAIKLLVDLVVLIIK